MKKLFLILFAFALFGAKANAQINNIPMDLGNWFIDNCATLEKSTEGLKLSGLKYGDGWVNMVTSKCYDFTDSEIFIKWRANGAGMYAAFSFTISGSRGTVPPVSCGTNHTTNNVFAGSTSIAHDQWYYSHFKINPDKSYTFTTSENNYPGLAGSYTFKTYESIVPEAVWDLVQCGTLNIIMNDNYGGIATYIEVAEVKTNAKEVKTSFLRKVYDFEDAAVPSVFNSNTTLTATGKMLELNGVNGDFIKLNVNEASAIVYNIYSDTTVRFLVDDSVLSYVSSPKCTAFFKAGLKGSHTLKWELLAPGKLTINDVKIFTDYQIYTKEQKANPGETIEIPVYVSPLYATDDIKKISFDFNYDSKILTYTGYANTSKFEGGTLEITPADGKISYVYNPTLALSSIDSVPLIKLKFTTKPGVCKPTISNVMYNTTPVTEVSTSPISVCYAPNAGADFTVDNSMCSLNASKPASGITKWILLSGQAIIDNVNSPNTTIQNLACGINVFQYQVSYNGCYRYDTVIVTNTDYIPCLAAYLPFNGNANDESGYKNNGVTNKTTPDLGRNDKENSSLLFDGSSSYISIPQSPTTNFSYSNNWTISAWVKPNYIDAASTLYDKTSDANGALNFRIGITNDGRLQCFLYKQGDNELSFETNYYLNFGTWNFISVEKENDVLKLFINGRLDKLSNISFLNTASINTSETNIGRTRSSNSDFYGGLIDELRIFNRSLSEKEIFDLYMKDNTPTANFSYESMEGGLFFNNNSEGYQLSYYWTINDTASTNAYYPESLFLEKAGVYNICLTVMDSLGRTDKMCSNYVNSGDYTQPVAYFSADIMDKTVNFQNLSTGDLKSYFWELGDGKISTAYNPTNIYAEGIYNVCLTVESTEGESQNYCEEIQIGSPEISPIKASFSFIPTDSLIQCTAETDNNITSYYWEFGDGNTDTTIYTSNIYATPGKYEICLTVGDDFGQTDRACETITINDENPIIPDFVYMVKDKQVKLSNQSSGKNLAWLWEFGDGESSDIQNTEHTYSEANTYEVCLTAMDTINHKCEKICKNLVISDSISMNAMVKAYFDVIVDGDKASFANKSFGENLIYKWSFGDGQIADGRNAEHTYSATGFYEVNLLIRNSESGKTSEISRHISIEPKTALIENCKAYFEYFSDKNTNEIIFMNKSVGNYSNVSWNFGHPEDTTGTYSNERNPSHLFPKTGFYEVTLTLMDEENQCFDSKTITVSAINSKSETNNIAARFAYMFDGNMLATLINRTRGLASGCTWFFGDGTDTTLTWDNPSWYLFQKKYGKPGFFPIRMEVWNETRGTAKGNNKKSIGFIPARQRAETGAIDYGLYGAPDFNYYVEDKKLILNDKSLGTVTKWKWNFADGTTEILTNSSRVEHQYTDSGYYEVCLTTTDGYGNELIACEDIRIGDAKATETTSIQNEISTKNTQITAYPNPARTVLNFIGSAKITQIEILDISGRICKNEIGNKTLHQTISIENLNSGLYLYIIKTEHGIQTGKIMKQ